MWQKGQKRQNHQKIGLDKNCTWGRQYYIVLDPDGTNPLSRIFLSNTTYTSDFEIFENLFCMLKLHYSVANLRLEIILNICHASSTIEKAKMIGMQ